LKVLLDTCAIVWAAVMPERLSVRSREMLLDAETVVSVSAISCAEIACAALRGRLRLSGHFKPWFRRVVSRNGWDVVAIDLPIVEEAWSLPGSFHRDPGDRFIVATSRVTSSPIITGDRKILDYPHVETIW